MNEITWNEKKISYIDQGKGLPVVLLHGYLETKEVWYHFAQQLSTHCRVIIPDIPGHGNSEVLAETHSMELIAQAIQELLQWLKVEKCVMVGHSMGGYVMLAFAQLFPQRLEAWVLFHSSVYADSDEKKESRLKEIELIDNGLMHQIIDNHLPKTFAPDNLTRVQPEIDKLRKRALKHNPKGVCALIRGMMERPDRQNLIQNCEIPMLFIFGKNDQFISVELAQKMISLNQTIQVKWLMNSGHMGFIEEPNEAIETIVGLIKTASEA